MRCFTPVAGAVLLVAAVGCRGSEEITPVPLRESVPPVQAIEPSAPRSNDPFAMFYETPSEPGNEGTVFVAAEDASKCPKIEVKTDEEATIDLQPGVGGRVTLVIFWSVETPVDKVAARHVSDLQKKYSSWVTAVGIVLNTPNVDGRRAFAAKQRIEYPLYRCMDLAGLRKMTSAIDAKVVNAVPAIFIIDRRLRLRFYRPGFAFAMGARGPAPGSVGGPSTTELPVVETVPAGEAIEDYLQRILAER